VGGALVAGSATVHLASTAPGVRSQGLQHALRLLKWISIGSYATGLRIDRRRIHRQTSGVRIRGTPTRRHNLSLGTGRCSTTLPMTLASHEHRRGSVVAAA